MILELNTFLKCFFPFCTASTQLGRVLYAMMAVVAKANISTVGVLAYSVNMGLNYSVILELTVLHTHRGCAGTARKEHLKYPEYQAHSGIVWPRVKIVIICRGGI